MISQDVTKFMIGAAKRIARRNRSNTLETRSDKGTHWIGSKVELVLESAGRANDWLT